MTSILACQPVLSSHPGDKPRPGPFRLTGRRRDPMTLAPYAQTVFPTATVACGLAQQPTTRGNGRSADTACNDGWNDRRASYCEVREAAMPAGSLLDIDAGQNGGIRLRGWD